jgi:hypothetical protein
MQRSTSTNTSIWEVQLQVLRYSKIVMHVMTNMVDLNLTWAEGIRGLVEEKGLMEEEWNDRGNWRKKII